MSDVTFADAIEKAAGGQIEAVVIGGFGWSRWDESNGYSEGHRGVPLKSRGVVLSWDDARPLLDYEWDSGFGAPDCHAIYAWTADRIIFVSEYDGSTGLESIPRNPVATHDVSMH